MNSLLHYQYTTKQALSVNQLIIEQKTVKKDSNTNSFNVKLQNERPILISVDSRYNEDTMALLSLSLSLSAKSSLQYVQGSKLMSPVDIVSITHMVSCSFRTFTFSYPEYLSKSSQWWLLNTIPARIIQQEYKPRDDTYNGYSSIAQNLPDTFTIPITGLLIFITKQQKQYEQNHCMCVCKHQMCINQCNEPEEEYVQQVPHSQNQNLLFQLFLDRSYYIDLLCAQGGCRYYNDMDVQQFTIKASNNSNSVAIQTLNKMHNVHMNIHSQMIKSDLQLSDIAMDKNEGCIIPAKPINVSGFQLITQTGIGLINSYHLHGISLCFSYNNSLSSANCILQLHCASSNQQLIGNAQILCFGQLATNLDNQLKQQDLTSKAIIYLASNPLCYQKLNHMLNQTTSDFVTLSHFSNLKRAPITTIYVFEQLSHNIFDQQKLKLLASISQKIFLTKSISNIFNNHKIAKQYLQCYKSYIYPLIFDSISSHYDNIRHITQLFTILEQNKLFPQIQVDNYTVTLETQPKTQKQTEIKQTELLQLNKLSNAIPDFLQFVETNAVLIKPSLLQQLQQVNSQQLQSINLKLFTELFEQQNLFKQELANSLYMDQIYPEQLIQYSYSDSPVNILQSINLNNILMTSDNVWQTYDIFSKLLLQQTALQKFKSQIKDQSVSFYYNCLSGQFVQIKATSFYQILLNVSSQFQSDYNVPTKPSDFYIYINSTMKVMHAKDIIGVEEFQNDVFAILPDLSSIQQNLSKIVNVQQINNASKEIFNIIYGQSFMLMVEKVFELIDKSQQTLNQFNFLNQEQSKEIIYKLLTQKIYYSNKEHDINTPFSGQYIKLMNISDYDTSIPYLQPLIITDNMQISIFQESFKKQYVQFKNDNIITFEYVSNIFLRYFTYLIGIENQISNQQIVLKYIELLKFICNQNSLCLQTIFKLMISWTSLVRQSLFEPSFDQTIKEKMFPTVATGFYNLLCNLFSYKTSENTDFESLNGLLLKYLVLKSKFITKNAFSFIETEMIQSPQFYVIAIKVLGCILCIQCNIQLVFESIYDADLFTQIINEKLQIQNYCDDYFNILSQNAQTLLVFTSEQNEIINQSKQNIIFITKIETSIFQKATQLENCENMSVNTIRNMTMILKEQKHICSQILKQLEESTKIQNIDELIFITRNLIDHKLYFEDSTNILKKQFILQNNFNFVTLREKAIILTNNNTVLHIIQSLTKNQFIKEIIQLSFEQHQLQQSLIFALSNDVLLLNVRYLIEPQDLLSIQLLNDKNQLINCLNKMHKYSTILPSFELNDVLEIIGHELTWSNKNIQNQYSTIKYGSNINIIMVDQLQFQQKRAIMYQVQNSLSKLNKKWENIQNVAQLTQLNVNYCCEIEIYDTRMFRTIINNILLFQPQNLCLVIFSKQFNDIQLLNSYYNYLCVYQITVQNSIIDTIKIPMEQIITVVGPRNAFLNQEEE
ncbi:Conserved_hypothetical protein [Hexamita inflata]|uniref:Uncharacterized protein n=1 Tax=Hexamita inflata TaxID=28002 RepID=A0AA86TUI1_9EUKA|nr:Conserved hypothetical protein [Hexamita inflata]